LAFRLVFILVGLELLERFDWMMYLFGGLLVFTGIRLMIKKEEQIQPEKNPVVRLARRFLPLTHEYRDGHFFTRVNGRLVATPLFLVVLLVETTDVIFAADSIPAILGITRNAFVVYTSNVFAILGLRALYFVLASVMQMFHYLSYGLAVILIIIGVKMLAMKAFHLHVPVGWSLGLVAFILAGSVIASILFPQPPKHEPPREEPPKADGPQH
jgi:tellurite resistance protein TerC